MALIEHLLHPLANKKTAAPEGAPITHNTLRCRSRGYYSKRDAERGIPVRQKVEYKSVQELWKQLKALPSQYNCNYSIPQSDEVEKLFEIFNLMSGDKASNDAIIKSVNSVPRFKLDELCKIAMTEMEVQKESGPPKEEKEKRRQFHEISRIALRNGILPSALYLYVTKTMKIN